MFSFLYSYSFSFAFFLVFFLLFTKSTLLVAQACPVHGSYGRHKISIYLINDQIQRYPPSDWSTSQFSFRTTSAIRIVRPSSLTLLRFVSVSLFYCRGGHVIPLGSKALVNSSTYSFIVRGNFNWFRWTYAHWTRIWRTPNVFRFASFIAPNRSELFVGY